METQTQVKCHNCKMKFSEYFKNFKLCPWCRIGKLK